MTNPNLETDELPFEMEPSSNHAREDCPSPPESTNVGDLKSNIQDKVGNLTTAPGNWGEVDAKIGEVKE